MYIDSVLGKKVGSRERDYALRQIDALGKGVEDVILVSTVVKLGRKVRRAQPLPIHYKLEVLFKVKYRDNFVSI